MYTHAQGIVYFDAGQLQIVHQILASTTYLMQILSLVCFNKVKDPKATIYFHHGLGDHCERYSAAFEEFNKHQIQVVSFDCRGHGKSLGLNSKAKKGHMGPWEQQKEDLEHFIKSTESVGPKILVQYP